MLIPCHSFLKQHGPAAIIAGLFGLLALTYSFITPIFESPDELWHYPFVWHLARTGELPVQDPANPQLWRQEGSQPPLYYALAALLTAAIPADDLPALIYLNPHADIGLISPDGNANIVVHTGREQWPWQGAVLAIHLARLFSVALGAGTVLSIYALGRLLWPEQPALALLAIAFVAFNPMFLFISGSVNNDNLITFLASVTVWRLVSLIVTAPVKPAQPNQHSMTHDHSGRAGPSLWQFVSLGILVGLAALSKVSGLGLLILVGLVLFIHGSRGHDWRTAILGNTLVGLLAVAIAGWWYWRNISLYGEWTGTETMIRMMGGRPIPPTAGQLLAEMPGLFRSFWGVFGYFSLAMPEPLYWLLNSFLLIGFIGLPAGLPAGRGSQILGRVPKLPPIRLRSLPGRFWQAWPVLSGWIILMVLGLLEWTWQTPATQGRLLFPTLAALAILWAGGWLALAPPRWRLLPAAMMAAIALWVPWNVIKPAYAPPEPITLKPLSTQRLDVVFGGTIHLLAYEMAGETTVKPDGTLPLTLYWRGEQQLKTDYTVFIHLVDEYDLIIAQRDVFHGPGVYPTSQWLSGQMFADTYSLPIPRTTFTPSQAHLVVGLYDHTTGARLLTSSGEDHSRFGQVKIEALPGDLPNPQSLVFEDSIRLSGYNLDRRRVEKGGQIRLTLYWQGEGKPDQNYKVFVHMVSSQQVRVAQHDSEPGQGAVPTSSWAPGQIIVDEHPLTISPEALPGSYRLIVGLYEGETGRRLRLLRNEGVPVQADSVTLGGVQVIAPDR